MSDTPSKLLTDWVYDAKNDGTYSLGIGHADYCRLYRAVESIESENAKLREALHWAMARIESRCPHAASEGDGELYRFAEAKALTR